MGQRAVVALKVRELLQPAATRQIRSQQRFQRHRAQLAPPEPEPHDGTEHQHAAGLALEQLEQAKRRHALQCANGGGSVPVAVHSLSIAPAPEPHPLQWLAWGAVADLLS